MDRLYDIFLFIFSPYSCYSIVFFVALPSLLDRLARLF